MEEKKIVFKSIDEQLAEDERRDATAMRSQTETSKRSSDKAVERTATGPKRGRKKLRLKKSARRTIGSLMLATSIVIGVIPVGGVSADTDPVSDYQGNTTPAPSIDSIDDTTSTTECKIPAAGVTLSGYVGGFPLVTEYTDNGGDKFTPHVYDDIGRKYYKVDERGYGDVAPIYIQGYQNAGQDAVYLKKYIGELVGYRPEPNGNLNLVSGYITNTTKTEEIWEKQDASGDWYMYRLTLVPYTYSKSDTGLPTDITIYGKKLEQFGLADLWHTVTFKKADGTFWADASVKHGEAVPADKIPPAPPAPAGKQFAGWDPSITQIVTADMDFKATYEDIPPTTSPRKSTNGIEDEPVDPENSTNGIEDEPVDPENSDTETVVDDTNGTDAVTDESQELETLANSEENVEGIIPDDNTNQNDSSENNTDEIVTDVVENEHADAGNFGLTGILLKPFNPRPEGINHDYDDVAISTCYICDNVKEPNYPAIEQICDSAFKGTQNFEHVLLPATVSAIGNSAFESCSGLHDITFNSGLVSIGASSFKDSGVTTVYYTNSMGLKTIGAKAFAGSKINKLTMSPDETVVEHHCGDFTIPFSVKKIGNAAFYGTDISTIQFFETSECVLGDYVFAKCLGLKNVELSPDTGSDNIKDLHNSQGTFADCSELITAIMSPSLNGKLQPGTFGNCKKFTDITFQSANGTFSDNEFDKRMITVHGPDLQANESASLDPSTIGIASYVSSIGGDEADTGKKADGKDKNNDYVYQYEHNGIQYEVVNHVAYSSSTVQFPEFFDTPIDERTGGKFTYIIEIEEPNKNPADSASNIIKRKFVRTGTGTDTTEIGNRFGRRSSGKGFIYSTTLGKKDPKDAELSIFQNDNSVQYLKLTNLNWISKNCFKGSTALKELWAVSNGTEYREEAFSGINPLVRVTFAYGGESGSFIRSKCFAETPSLDFVDFIDDNLETGEKEKYARFFYSETDNSIASDAFLTSARSTEMVFKGPMLENFAPYRFAIDPVSRISATKQVYPYYFTGNPQNLTCQYIVNGVKRVDPEDGKEKDCSGVFLLYYPNTTSYVGAPEEKVSGQFEYLKLRECSELDPVTNEFTQIKNYDEYRKKYGDKSLSDIKGAVIDYATGTDTVPFEVPYGIDYLEKAVTYRCVDDPTDSSAKLDKYKIWQDNENIYESVDKNTYDIFKYNPDLKYVKFISGGVERFPDRMFECARNLQQVVFEGDVKELGNVPFYFPDTEADESLAGISDYKSSFSHNGPGQGQKGGDSEWRSHLDSVIFNEVAETNGTNNDQPVVGNGRYTSKHFDNSNNFLGIIESRQAVKDYKTGKVTVVQELDQIVPSRGDKIGLESISINELSGTTLYKAYAARDCDAIVSIAFPDEPLKTNIEIEEGCFMDCDRLGLVNMPNKFVSLADKAFGDINGNLTVRFPYNEANLNNGVPFESAANDGNSMPKVTFVMHRDAEALIDYAEKTDNVVDPDPENPDHWIPDDITLTYKASKESVDPTWQKTINAQADGKCFGVSYAPPKDEWPKNKNGKYPTWSGQELASGALVDWETTPLYADTVFTADYSDVEEFNIVFRPEYDGIKAGDDETYILKWKSGDQFYSSQAELKEALGVPEKARFENNWYVFSNFRRLPVSKYGDILDTKPEYESIIVYVPDSSSSSSSSSSSTSSSGGGGGTSGSSSRSSSSSSSSRSSSSSSSSTALPVFVNSQDAGAAAPVSAAGVNSTVYVGESSGSGSTGSGSGSNRGNGNTTVISTTGGITDTGKISATVNGSSDNYVIKITQTQEADEMGLQALHNEYGEDISAIRYLPFDISLYDSTGTNKISPVPEGVSVTLTMPIPDDLAIYGGNAKIASTAGGVMEKMQPRFTVIDGVPCMTYTCTHFSPYMVWVDTNNLTAAGIADATPKTADGIHPKWFLCFGLAAIAVVMFLKKDPEEYLKKKAA